MMKAERCNLYNLKTILYKNYKLTKILEKHNLVQSESFKCIQDNSNLI